MNNFFLSNLPNANIAFCPCGCCARISFAFDSSFDIDLGLCFDVDLAPLDSGFALIDLCECSK